MEGKEALQYRDMDSMRGFGVSAHYGNEGFDMRSKFALTGFVEGKKALKYRVESTCCFGGFAQGKEASECMGSSSHVGKWKRLHPKRVSSLKEKVDGPPSIYRAMRQLPKGVKLRGPYRALTFQEKEYYRKRAEESRGFDVPDIPDDIDPYEIDVKPFKLDQHPPGSKLWKKVQELTDYSKLALDKYNKCNSAAKYQFAKLIKANCRGGYPIEYFITFQAYDMACYCCKTFQASVTIGFKETTADCWPEPYPTS